ncbi:hypothetical protein CTZ27_19050 [Streptomyces griseocarneus]|nr:hypothetical protein CTZ27_19050 [Streptomyces griseocarneus]
MRNVAISLAVLLLGLGALTGTAAAASAAGQPAVAKQDTVTAMQCVAGGGFVDDDDPTSPTGMRCFGGQFDGVPVTLG